MKKILLDPGHGGVDSGVVGHGVEEKGANLRIAQACAKYLNDHYSGHVVIMARTDDSTVSLIQRRTLTARENPDIYISIHNNGFREGSANGYETFIHNNPRRVTVDYRDAIHDRVLEYIKTLGIRDRGKKRADHWVTREMPAPVVLMEYMFVTNPREAAYLRDPQVCSKLGEYTAKGIAEALNLPEAKELYTVIALQTRNRKAADDAIMRLRGQGFTPTLEIS